MLIFSLFISLSVVKVKVMITSSLHVAVKIENLSNVVLITIYSPLFLSLLRKAYGEGRCRSICLQNSCLEDRSSILLILANIKTKQNEQTKTMTNIMLTFPQLD